MKPILRTLLSDPHQAIVDLWCLLRGDYPRFQAAEQASIRDPDAHRRLCAGVLRAIETGEHLRAGNLPGDPEIMPLAVLQGLDEHLHRSKGTLSAPPPRICRASGGRSKFFIHRRPFPRPEGALHARQTGHLQGWLVHHWVVPCEIAGIDIAVRTAEFRLWSDLGELKAAGELPFFIGSFGDGVLPAWLPQDPPGWCAEDLTAPEIRWSSTLRALEEAQQAGARVVVLPELTLSPNLRQRAAAWLEEHETPFLLVLPGSFHTREDGRVYNSCELLDRIGVAVLRHRKLTTSNNGGGEERIATGTRIELLGTPLGLIGTPICLDFCEEGSPFSALWDEIGAEWLLVPAFGGASSLRAHRRRADALFRAHGSVTVLANQDPRGRNQCHGFVKHEPCRPQPASGTRRVVRVKLSSRS